MFYYFWWQRFLLLQALHGMDNYLQKHNINSTYRHNRVPAFCCIFWCWNFPWLSWNWSTFIYFVWPLCYYGKAFVCSVTAVMLYHDVSSHNVLTVSYSIKCIYKKWLEDNVTAMQRGSSTSMLLCIYEKMMCNLAMNASIWTALPAKGLHNKPHT